MSTLQANVIKNVAGVEKYLAQAWVNFDGTGTPAIRASGNVSSITDNGVGDYTINFTVPFADANYAAPAMSTVTVTGGAGNRTSMPSIRDKTTSSCRFVSTDASSGGVSDPVNADAAFFR